MSYCNVEKIILGQESIKPVAGPNGTHVHDLAILFKVAQLEQNDPHTVPIPFNEADYPFFAKNAVPNKDIVFGLFDEAFFVEASTPCKRALCETAVSLKKAGYTVKPFIPPRGLDELVYMTYAFFSADGGLGYFASVKDEPFEVALKAIRLNLLLPKWLTRTVASIASFCTGDKRIQRLSESVKAISAKELWHLQDKRDDLYKAFMIALNEQKIDCLLMPVNALPATPDEKFSYLNFCASYTLLANCFDLPAGVVPVTAVYASDHWNVLGPLSRLGLNSKKTEGKAHSAGFLEEIASSFYDESAMEGLPVGVQIVCRRYKEELTLAAMKIIQDLAKK